MASKQFVTIARCLCVMHVQVRVIVVVALCSGFRHLKHMRTVLKVLRIPLCVAENDVLFVNKVKTDLEFE